MKRGIVLFLSLVLCLTAFSFNLVAQEETTDEEMEALFDEEGNEELEETVEEEKEGSFFSRLFGGKKDEEIVADETDEIVADETDEILEDDNISDDLLLEDEEVEEEGSFFNKFFDAFGKSDENVDVVEEEGTDTVLITLSDDMTDLVQKLEKEYNVEIPNSEAVNFVYVEDILNYLQENASGAESWGIKAYVNGGAIEPWGDPGTGKYFNMGYHVGAGVLVRLGEYVDVPFFLDPLSIEVVGNYSAFTGKDWAGGSTSIISGTVNGRYDVTDLLFNALGMEPIIGVFGLVGLQYNYHQFDGPTDSNNWDATSSFGSNLGVGVKYGITDEVGLDLRFTQGLYYISDVVGYESHLENGFLLGVTFKIQ